MAQNLTHRYSLAVRNRYVANMMHEFDFTEEDLRTNRTGSISDRQRKKLQGRGRNGFVALVVAFVVLSVVITVTADSSMKNFAGPGVATAILWVPASILWWVFRYPLGRNRVKTIIGHVSLACFPNDEQLEITIGKSFGALRLPPTTRSLPPGSMVRVHYNHGWGKVTIHSIDFAGPNDTSNVKRRSIVIGSFIIVVLIAFLVLYQYAEAEQEAEQREVSERLEEFTVSIDDYLEIEPESLDSLFPQTSEELDIRNEVLERDLNGNGIPDIEESADLDSFVVDISPVESTDSD